MIDGRFDQHFAELIATSLHEDRRALSPFLARATGLICALGFAAAIGLMILG